MCTGILNEIELNYETSGSGHYEATISLMCVYVGLVSHGSNTFVTLWASSGFFFFEVFMIYYVMNYSKENFHDCRLTQRD